MSDVVKSLLSKRWHQ